jgi:ketosteroid isomerase-like protein
MSQENVAVVRQWIESFNRRGRQRLIELTEPGFEMKSLLVTIEGEPRGRTSFPHAYFEEVDDAYDHLEAVADEFIDAGDAVLVVARVTWRGKTSGVTGERPLVAAFWLRDGKVCKEETFTDRTEALEAVGLKPGY